MSLSRWLCFSRDQVYRVSHSGRKARYCPTRVVSFEHLSVQDCGSLCFVYETTRFERREPSGRAPLSDAEPARVYNQAVPRLFESSSHFDPDRVRQGCCLFGDELEIQYIWEYDVRPCTLDFLDHTLFTGVLILLPFFFLFYPPFFPLFLSLFHSRNSFVAVILRAHEKTPVPMTWSELVHLGGFGHVASEAITELRRSIEGTQRLWKKSRDGRLVLVNTPVSHTDSPAGLFGFLEGKGVETSAASSIAGLYPDACLHLHSLLREGRVHLASGRVFVGPPNPPGGNSLEDYRDRISKWREISSLN